MKKPKWAKPDSMKKLQRNHLLKDYVCDHPELPLHKIGAIFQITHQRVSQILKGR